MIDDLTYCLSCHSPITLEESKSHRCMPDIKTVKDITVDHINGMDDPDIEGDRIFLAFGMDETVYRIRECPHRPIHTSDENLQKRNPTDNGQNPPKGSVKSSVVF